MPSLMNVTVKIHYKTPHGIEVIKNQLLVLEPELLVLNETTSVQYISLHASSVTTWVVYIYFLAIFHLRHKLGSPMCGDFKD